MKARVRLVPVSLLVCLVIGLSWRLVSPPSPAVPSQLVERPAPEFDLPPLVPPKPGLKSADLATGKSKLVNIFASWCVPCVGESPALNDLKARGVKIDAIAVRDSGDAVTAFLRQYGDPYEAIGSDQHSNVQISLGSSGVPETFLIDGHGVIRRQYIGPLSRSQISQVMHELAETR